MNCPTGCNYPEGECEGVCMPVSTDKPIVKAGVKNDAHRLTGLNLSPVMSFSENAEITRLRERVAHMESALKNIAETSSSTRIRRLAKEALGKGGA